MWYWLILEFSSSVKYRCSLNKKSNPELPISDQMCSFASSMWFLLILVISFTWPNAMQVNIIRISLCSILMIFADGGRPSPALTVPSVTRNQIRTCKIVTNCCFMLATCPWQSFLAATSLAWKDGLKSKFTLMHWADLQQQFFWHSAALNRTFSRVSLELADLHLLDLPKFTSKSDVT